MASLKLISRRLLQLSEILDRNDVIFIEGISKEFRADPEQFIVGEALSITNGSQLSEKTYTATGY